MPPYEEFIEKIKPLWETRWLTNMGIYHKELEEVLKVYLGVKGISLIVNGHMALELAIQLMDFPEGSEVITTPYTFISTTHAIVRNKLKPVFCDIKESDYTIDEAKIENLITDKTVAIIPVHVYGNICNIEEIERIAYKYRLKVIYDACHAFGETYKGKGIGSYGDVSVFSFHATKVFNTIEGGAITFSQEEKYERLYNLKNFGIRGEELVVEIGANAKLNEFSSIMGLCNLQRVDEYIEKRKKNAHLYMDMLREVDGLRIPLFNQSGVCYNYGYFPVSFNNPNLRNYVYDMLKDKNIYTRKYFYPLTSDAACFRNRYRNDDLKVARKVAENILILPLYPELEEIDILQITDNIKKLMKEFDKY